MKKFFVAFGTRPELIKLAPLILQLKKENHAVVVCNTGQHKEMLTPLLSFFNITPDYNLEVMKDQQTLPSLTSAILDKITPILVNEKPELAFVQGDTTTAFVSALAAFYQKIAVAHIEAGLRTGDIYSPFPEEANRKFISQIAHWHFAPTDIAAENLKLECVTQNVIVTGNTSIDTLRVSGDLVSGAQFTQKIYEQFPRIKDSLANGKKIVLVTVHRRENHGEPLNEIAQAFEEFTAQNTDIEIVIPVHMNPAVQKILMNKFKSNKQVHLLPPLDYPLFIWFMKNSFFIMTDSGGVQEEAPYFKKPILVLRENTERPEGVHAGTAKLVGHKKDLILENCNRLVTDTQFYNSFLKNINPYGDGHATERILECITK